MANPADRIQIRRDTSSNWALANPILTDGEFGWDKTEKLLKVGDGTNAWNDLIRFQVNYKQVTYSGNRTLLAKDKSMRLRFTTTATLTLADVFDVGDRFEVYAAGGNVTLVDGSDSELIVSGGIALVTRDSSSTWLVTDYGGQGLPDYLEETELKATYAKTAARPIHPLNRSDERMNAVGDGGSHPLSERFGSVSEAQAVFPSATALSEQIDRLALQSALDVLAAQTSGEMAVPPGRVLLLDKPLTITKEPFTHPNAFLKVAGTGTLRKASGFVGDRLINMAVARSDEDGVVLEGLTLDGVDHSVNGVDWFDESVPFDLASIDHADEPRSYDKCVVFRDVNLQNFYRAVRHSGNNTRFYGGLIRANLCGFFGTEASNDVAFFGTAFRRNHVGAQSVTARSGLTNAGWHFSGAIFESNRLAGFHNWGGGEITFIGGYWEANSWDLTATAYDGGSAVPTHACHLFNQARFGYANGLVLIGGQWWPISGGYDVVSQHSRHLTLNGPRTYRGSGTHSNVDLRGRAAETGNATFSSATDSGGNVVAGVPVRIVSDAIEPRPPYTEVLHQTVATSATHNFGVIRTRNHLLTARRGNGGAEVWLIGGASLSVVKLGGVGNNGTAFFDGGELKFTGNANGVMTVTLQRID